MKKVIEVPIYWGYDYDGVTKLYDIEGMREEFEKKLEELQK